MSQASTHMDLLRGWIGPRVHQALTEALDWKTQRSPATNDAQQAKFEDDGNSLRVRSSKKEYVQICKIEEFSRPVQLWLSDTKTLLKVIVAAAAADRFENEHRRRVTEGTLGAVIQIHDYEIVAQHHGPKRTKITMLINSFIHCGSDGSSPFGTPCSIECQPPIIELLEKLQTLRAHEQPTSQSPASFKAARDHLASPSQATSISSADDGTQAIFATQMPRLQSKKRLREGSLKSNEYQASALDESDSARSLSIVNGGGGSDLSHGRQAPSNLKDIAKNINGQSDSGKRVPEQEEAPKLSRIKVEDTLTKQSELLKLLARNNVKAPQLQHRVVKASEPASEQASRMKLEADQAQDPVISPSIASKDPSPDRQTSRSIPISIVQQSRVTKPAQRLSISPQAPNKAARQSFKASTRISGRDISISAAQRDLLARADSWYPPEPGHRPPSANIPISLLQELNSQAERQAGSLRESVQVSSQSESSEVEVNDNKNFESEEPFPTEEWPDSPPAQVVLPPDSSLNSARSPQSNLNEQSPEPEHDHDLNITTSIEEDYSRLKRSPSTNSLSPQSDMSSRSYLPRAAKTNSSRPSRYSSKVSTPLQRRSLAPPRNATTTNSSPAKDPSELAQQKRAHNHSHYVSDQSRLQSQEYSINIPNVSDKSDAEHVSGVNNSNDSPPRDTANPPSTIPRSHEAFSQARNMTSNASSRRNSSTWNLALEPSNPAQNSSISHQSSKQEPSEIPNSSSNQNGKLQSKPSDIGLSDSESEASLETSMPHGLDEAKDVLSTIPFTQVNRTPYMSNDSLRSPLCSASPTGANKGFSRHSGGGTIEMGKSHLSEATTDVDHVDEVLNTYGTGNYQELPQSGSTSHAGYSKPRVDQGSSLRQGNSSATDHHISMIEETVLPPGTLPDASKTSILPPHKGTTNSYLDQKRKASEPVLSPNVTKRRKGLKLDRVMSDLSTTGRKVDPEDIGRQLRHEFFAHRKSLTAQIDNDGKDAADILGSPKSASTNFPEVINNILPESPTASVTRENPNSLDETVEKPSSEETFTALKTPPVVLAPQMDVQAQDVSIKTPPDSVDHNDPKESDVGNVHRAEVAPSILPSVEVSATACQSKTQNSVFDRFVMTYPDYPGNSVQFAAICSRICILFQKDRMEHPSLWDDFIVRHRTEYPQYMSQCADEAVDPMPFERYYRSKILQAKYVSPTGPVVTPINIHEFQPHEPKHYTSTTRESSIGQARYVSPKGPVVSPINIRELQPHEPKNSTSRASESSIGKIPPSATSNREETESKTIEVIELSDQSDSSEPIDKAKSMVSSRPKEVRRSLPWKNSSQVPNGESPGIKHTPSTPITFVASQRSSAKTSVFKEARQKATPVTPSAGRPPARAEKFSNPLSQPGLRNGAPPTPALNNHHPPPSETSNANEPAKQLTYNEWARDYQAIIPGNRNSYAQGNNASQPPPKPKNNPRKPKPFNPFVLEL